MSPDRSVEVTSARLIIVLACVSEIFAWGADLSRRRLRRAAISFTERWIWHCRHLMASEAPDKIWPRCSKQKCIAKRSCAPCLASMKRHDCCATTFERTRGPTSPRNMANVVSTSAMTVAIAVAAVAYGVVLSLSFNCLYLLWSSRATATRMRWRLFIYVSWTLLLATCTFAFQIRYTQDFLSPQSPSDLTYRNHVIVSALAFVQHWSTDGLVLYRCHIIYAFKIKIFVGFGLLYAACVDSTEALNLMLASLAVASVLHVSLQVAVIGRVLYFRRLSRRVNADKVATSQHRDAYTSLASILIESAFLDNAAMVVYIVVFVVSGFDGSLSRVFSFLVGPVLAIASLLIITRVAHGRGCSQSTSLRLTGPIAETNQSGMVFADRAAEDSTIANSIA